VQPADKEAVDDELAENAIEDLREVRDDLSELGRVRRASPRVVAGIDPDDAVAAVREGIESRNVAAPEGCPPSVQLAPLVADAVQPENLDPLQVRVFESAGVLEAVADRSIHADVRHPDQRHRDGGVRPGHNPDRTQNYRKRVRVNQVIRCRTNALDASTRSMKSATLSTTRASSAPGWSTWASSPTRSSTASNDDSRSLTR
jgi:hypothetical protein